MSLLEEVNGWVERNRERVLSTVSDLIRIRTENLPPGGNEKPGQEYLHAFASRFLPAGALEFFEVDDVKMRFRPSFFPFTEPSMEVDIQCKRDKNEVRFGEGEDWMEILGCGMVHPNVIRNCGLDPDAVQGFAWGMGIDRIAMLKYGMPDLRPFFEADVRWLNHYGFRPLDFPTLAGGLSP